MINQLRASLWVLISQFDVELPECLPILGYELLNRGHNPGDDRSIQTQSNHERHTAAGREDGIGTHLPLSVLLSLVLLAFAIEFEGESDISLAISANLLRVLDEQGVRVRDLPHLAGVSKEAISMAIGILQKRRIAVVEPDPSASRGKVVRLTSKGREAQDASRQLLGVIEERWQTCFGKDTISTLRELLEQVVGVPTAQLSPLFQGLEPYPDGWRASVRKPDILPYYPMVLHRGGFPDGS